MHNVRLTGELICKDETEAAVIIEHLPVHLQLTRAEPGCLSFDVTATDDPLVWAVAELFTDRVAFEAHQGRIAQSEWGRVTSGIERRYTVDEVAPEPT